MIRQHQSSKKVHNVNRGIPKTIAIHETTKSALKILDVDEEKQDPKDNDESLIMKE